LSVSTVQIELPADLTAFLGVRRQATENVKEFVVLGLYQEGRISGGKAAELLGMTKAGFISLLARKRINYFQLTPEELAEDIADLKSWRAETQRG